MKKGFDRLKGVAAASAMGLGLLAAGGSARAASTSTSAVISRALAATINSINLVGTWTITNSTTTSTTSSSNSLPGYWGFGISEYSGDGTAGIPTGTAPSSTTTSAFSDAFDGVLHMTVGGNAFNNPDATVDLTGDVITSDTVVDIVAGIDAQIQFAFDPATGGDSLGVVRALYTLTNTTGAPISTTAKIYGNLGSDSSTTIQSSSSGDAVADDSDMWTVSTETSFGNDPVVGDDPGLVITRYGTGASVVPTQSHVLGSTADTDTFGNDYDLTIPANSTQRLLVFIDAHKTNAGAATSAAGFETLEAATTAGHLTGLTETQLSEVVNYAIPVVTPAPNPAPAPAPTSSSGSVLSMGLPGLLAMLGMLPVLRLLRKTK